MKKLLILTTIFSFAVFKLSAQQNSHRIIRIFTADVGNASFINQKSMLVNAQNLEERDIKVEEIIASKSNQNLFKKYKANPKGFTFILFGKDGGEKMRSTQPVSLEKLYQVIDSMPMRKNEMQNNR
ncbi:MAG: DUF4174 domain-containing protein [Sphingobacteriaceae bacterium]|nr:MAG: DUF4174 domain-containing protein [Sphingobacteriaceae bacterium]